jgi:hypothetical protein
MLDAYIIEELRRREREQRDREQPALELPIDDRRERSPAPKKDDDTGDETHRGVIVIDL